MPLVHPKQKVDPFRAGGLQPKERRLCARRRTKRHELQAPETARFWWERVKKLEQLRRNYP